MRNRTNQHRCTLRYCVLPQSVQRNDHKSGGKVGNGLSTYLSTFRLLQKSFKPVFNGLKATYSIPGAGTIQIEAHSDVGLFCGRKSARVVLGVGIA